MTDERVSDEMLMAFVDGELGAEAAAGISAAIAGNPELGRRADMFAWSREASADAYADVLSEPVPLSLLQGVLGYEAAPMPGDERRPLADTVVPFRARPRTAPLWGLPLAACIALAIGIGGGYRLAGSPAETPGLIAQAPALLTALASQPSGPPAVVDIDGWSRDLSVLGSYRVADGLCRAFALRGSETSPGARGLACDHGEGYRVEIALSDDAGDPGTFSPASDRAASTIDAYLGAREASPALDLAEESELLRGPRAN